jgi:hypothetical protein
VASTEANGHAFVRGPKMGWLRMAVHSVLTVNEYNHPDGGS